MMMRRVAAAAFVVAAAAAVPLRIFQDVNKTVSIGNDVCAMFVVDFSGGKDTELRVTVDDSTKSLAYVAVTVSRYNNRDVAGFPNILQQCGQRSPSRSWFDNSLTRPTCWGSDYNRVDVAGYPCAEELEDSPTCQVNCNDYLRPYKVRGGDSTVELKVRASDSDGCKTRDGAYYVYLYATKPTEANVLVTAKTDGVKKDCKDDKKNEQTAIILMAVLIPLGCCCCFAIAAMISMQMQKSQQAHMAAPAYGDGPATTQQQQQDWGAQPASYASTTTPHNTPDPSSTGAPIGTVVGVGDAPPAYGSAPPTGTVVNASAPPPPPSYGAPITGTVTAPPPPAGAPITGTVVTGTVVGGDAPPAYGA